MRNLLLDEETGEIFTEDGEHLGSLNDFFNSGGAPEGMPEGVPEDYADAAPDIPDMPDDGGLPDDADIPDDMPDMSDMSDDMSPTPYGGSEGLSETLIKKETTFALPQTKKCIQDALWIMFDGGIHQAMTNTSNAEQQKKAMDLMHASIIAALADSRVAREMTPADYIQLHHWARNLIARSTTYEGDGLRDATILGRTLNPGLVDALHRVPDVKKTSKEGGFFSFLKRN